MMNIQELKQALNAGAYDETFRKLYPGRWEGQRERYLHIVNAFAERFGEEHVVEIYSAPGRSEIGGNHTDHQRGRVLAAAVTLDAVARSASIWRNWRSSPRRKALPPPSSGASPPGSTSWTCASAALTPM